MKEDMMSMNNPEIVTMGENIALKESTIFIAGVYGTGKSTMGSVLSEILYIPAFSTDELISAINVEHMAQTKHFMVKYQPNFVRKMYTSAQLEKQKNILTEYFYIFKADNDVKVLPKLVHSTLEY